MARIIVITTVKIGRRNFKVRSFNPVFDVIKDACIEGTHVQLKLLAYGYKDLLIDRLLAYKSPLGEPVVKRELGIGGTPEPPVQRPVEPITIKERILAGKNLVEKRALPLKKQRFPFKNVPPLSRAYLKEKIRKGKDPRVGISTGEYIRNIVIRTVKETEGKGYLVTLSKREHSSGIHMHLLAKIIEYGTGGYYIRWFGNPNRLFKIQLRPRKHWQPALDDILEVRKEVGLEARADTLREKMAILR